MLCGFIWWGSWAVCCFWAGIGCYMGLIIGRSQAHLVCFLIFGFVDFQATTIKVSIKINKFGIEDFIYLSRSKILPSSY